MQSKTDVCHLGDEGTLFVVTVADPAIDAHLAHGDHVVTAEVCGNGVDDDCDGQVDEDCAAATCPCQGDLDIDTLGLTSADRCSEVGDVITFGGRLGEAMSSNTQCRFRGFLGTTSHELSDEQEADACHAVISLYAASLNATCVVVGTGSNNRP